MIMFKERRYKKENAFKTRIFETYDEKVSYILSVVSSCRTYDQLYFVEDWAYGLGNEWHRFELHNSPSAKLDKFVTAYFNDAAESIYQNVKKQINEIAKIELETRDGWQ